MSATYPDDPITAFWPNAIPGDALIVPTGVL